MFKIDDLVETYVEIRALDGCSFSVAPGRMLGFLGPNGAGKTTTMRAVFGLVTPDSGTVTWRGKQIGPEERLRFGYMPLCRRPTPLRRTHQAQRGLALARSVISCGL